MPKKATKTVAKKAASKTPVKKVSRTTMLKILSETAGRFFTSTHIGKDNKPHTINGIRMKVQDHPMGYIRVYSTKAKEIRMINPQTITDLVFKGVHNKLKK